MMQPFNHTHGGDVTLATKDAAMCPFLRGLLGSLLVVSAALAASPTDGAITHRFIAFGSSTRIVEADGTTSWTYPESTRDGQVLQNGNILLALSKSENYPGGAVVEVPPAGTTGGKIVFEFAGTQSEINTVQRLENGNTLVVEAGARPRILELDRRGRIAIELALRGQTDNHHMQSRMTRKLAQGHYLVPQLLDRVVRQYTPKGDIAWEYKTPDEPKDAWPFTAIRLDNGNTLITCTHANMVIEVDAAGAIVWKVSNADFEKPFLNDPCGAQRLANGNTVICSYAVGEGGTKLVEVTREKKVVWTFVESDGPGIHEVQILATDGVTLPERPMR